MSKLFNISTFIYSFFMPFQDLPRLEVMGMSIRVAVFAIVPIAFFLFYNFVWGKISWEKIADIKTNCLFATFFIGMVLLFANGPTARSMGFQCWFAFNIVYFLSVVHIDHRGALWGFLGGQIFNSCYILLQNYLYPWIWVPESYFNAFRSGQFRNFGLMGEPSFVAILLVPALIYVYDRMEGYRRNLLCALFIVSLFLVYSGVGLISLGIFIIFALVRDRMRFVKLALPLLFAGFLLSVVQHPQYYGIPYKGLPKLSDWRSFDARKKEIVEDGVALKKYSSGLWTSGTTRLDAFTRGFYFLKKYPWGVGPSNSKKGLIALYYPNGIPEGMFVQGIHNIFLEIAIEFGILGLMTFLLFILFLMKPLFLAKEWTLWAISLGMMVPMQFAQNINMPGMWIVFAVVTGIYNTRRSSVSHYV